MAKKKNKIKWIPFTDKRTLKLKDRDIAKGKVIIDSKNYRWRKKK
jgi:hypothetical protein